jgi:hypothetical protein
MHNNIPSGEKIVTSFVVGPEDTASFGGVEVHPVCSTFAMAREAEWACRQFVLKLREDHEEGIGNGLTIEHKAPALMGQRVDVIATLEFLTEVSKPETIVDRITQSGIWFGTGGSGFNLTFDLSGPRVLSRAIRWRFVAANDATIQQEITARVDASRTWNERALHAALTASLKDFPAPPVNQRVIQQPLTDRP